MAKVVITGAGCIFADSIGVESFWNNILEERKLHRPLSDERWSSIPKKIRDRIDRHYEAAFLSEDIMAQIAKETGLPFEHHSRLEIIVQASCQQALDGIPAGRRNRKGGLILGAMNPDDEYNLGLGQAFDLEFLEKAKSAISAENHALQFLSTQLLASHQERFNRKDRYVASTAMDRIAKRLELSEASILVDAACGSSLAALEIANLLVGNGIWDYALVGGAETNLSPGSFRTFEAVGALSKQNCLPFDQKTDGLLQGEGCGILLIERDDSRMAPSEAPRAYIRSVAGSSDGRTTSLFQPSQKGQELAYARAHESLSESLDYVEAHGTGTVTGDKTEIDSLSNFLGGRKIPLSSLKGQFGHTKGAAGAAGLLKALCILKDQTLPPASYLKNPLNQDFLLSLRKSEIRDQLNCLGVSSFGFGGSNFHAVISRNPPPSATNQESRSGDVVVLAKTERTLKDFDPSSFSKENHFYRLPPKSLENIDPCQTLALTCVIDALRSLDRDISFLPTQETLVISASILGLPDVSLMAKDLKLEVYEKLLRSDTATSPDQIEMLNFIEKFRRQIPAIGEDFSTGVLNNVIAGRICHAFNFQGASYNIESGLDSEQTAERILFEKLRRGDAQLGILVSIQEHLQETSSPVVRTGARAKILARTELAQKLFLRPLERLERPNS